MAPDLGRARIAARAKSLSGLTPERIAVMRSTAAEVEPSLDFVTDRFYARLAEMPDVRPLLAGRMERLRQTFRAWVGSLFGSDFGTDYAEAVWRIGEAHFAAGVPIDCLTGSMTVVQEALQPVVLAGARGRPFAETERLAALNAALGYSLIVMQGPYWDARAPSGSEP
jgi:truncated hemoglobin YjbI